MNPASQRDDTLPPDPRRECEQLGHLWQIEGRVITRTLTRFYCKRCSASRDVDTLND